ncbi:fungal-specific transcription factor [Rhypophila decipiens]
MSSSHTMEDEEMSPGLQCQVDVADSITSSSPPDHPSVRPVACLLCRGRKSQCSKDKPMCDRCRKHGLECVYEEARKITVNELYLRELEGKVKRYESTLAERLKNSERLSYERNIKGPGRRTARPRAVTTSHHSASGRDCIRQESDEQVEDDHVLLGPFTQLSLERPSTSFKGPGSSDNFLRNVRQVSGVPGDDESLDLSPNFYDPGALPSRRLLTLNHVRLPPLDVARRLFAAQYTYIGTIFAFTDPTAFDQELIAAYRGQPDLSDKDACLGYAKVLITLAFGQLYSVNQWIDFKGPPGFEYFTQALQLLPDPHEEGSILCVETLALVGYFMQNMNRRDVAFLYIGMALRMAISLGLHQEVKSSASDQSGLHDLDEAVREHRRRVWWSIYSLDRILSAKSGNPITIQDEDIGVALPSKLPGEADYCPAVVLRHYTQLSRILGDIHKSIYSSGRPSPEPKSGRRLMASVQSTIRALSEWNQKLPVELRFEPSRLNTNRESVSTFSHYCQCVNMTARPLFFHVVQKRLRDIRAKGPEAKEKDWKEGLGQTTVKMIEMCVSAAQDTVHMMTIAAKRNLVATYGYMDGEHIFSATIVLVMMCIAFPANPVNTKAMNDGLGLLRGMAERGNSHMGARYEMLAQIRSSAVPDEDDMEHQYQPISVWPRNLDIFPGPTTQDFGLSSPDLSGAWSFGYQSPSTNSLLSAQFAMLGGPLSPVMPGLSPHRQSVGAASSPEVLGAGPSMAPGTEDQANHDAGPGSYERLAKGKQYPVFNMVDHMYLGGEELYDESANTGTDLMFWEEGFANPAADSGFDLTQLTQTGETDIFYRGWLGGHGPHATGG